MKSAGTVKQLEKQLNHTFKDKELLRHALTHSSTGEDQNYERLEFLGDRVLGLVIAQALYERFPDEAEGDLAKRLAALVQGELLAEIASQIELGQFIILSEAEAQAGGAQNENILSDVFEALIGALYIDGGLKKCEALINGLWEGRFTEMKTPPQHPKTRLQEWAQGKGLPLPSYKVIGQSGPDHAPVFEIQLTVKGYEPVSAEGYSRQEAEKQAAKAFFEQEKLK
jgi:ribonuclease-3